MQTHVLVIPGAGFCKPAAVFGNGVVLSLETRFLWFGSPVIVGSRKRKNSAAPDKEQNDSSKRRDTGRKKRREKQRAILTRRKMTIRNATVLFRATVFCLCKYTYYISSFIVDLLGAFTYFAYVRTEAPQFIARSSTLLFAEIVFPLSFKPAAALDFALQHEKLLP